MAMRVKLATIAGLGVLAASLPAATAERELVATGGWRAIEAWDDRDESFLVESDCVMRHPVAYEGASERIEVYFAPGQAPGLKVEMVIPAGEVDPASVWPAEGQPASMADWPAKAYPTMAYAFSGAREPAADLQAIPTVAALTYRAIDAGQVRMQLSFDADAEMIEAMAPARWLHLWELDEASQQALSHAAFELGEPARALDAVRRCVAG